MAIFSVASVDGKRLRNSNYQRIAESSKDQALKTLQSLLSELGVQSYSQKSKLLDRLQSQSKLESLTSVIAADATSTKATVTSELIDALATLRTTP